MRQHHALRRACRLAAAFEPRVAERCCWERLARVVAPAINIRNGRLPVGQRARSKQGALQPPRRREAMQVCRYQLAHLEHCQPVRARGSSASARERQPEQCRGMAVMQPSSSTGGRRIRQQRSQSASNSLLVLLPIRPGLHVMQRRLQHACQRWRWLRHPALEHVCCFREQPWPPQRRAANHDACTMTATGQQAASAAGVNALVMPAAHPRACMQCTAQHSTRHLRSRSLA